MLYELINPSDPYTFKAKDREVAALTVFILGTLYGAETEDRNEVQNVPIFLFGGAVEWYKDVFKRTPDEGLEVLRTDVISALESFIYGKFSDRNIYETAANAITDTEKLDEFKKTWHDQHSSLNDIGSVAWKWAEKLKE